MRAMLRARECIRGYDCSTMALTGVLLHMRARARARASIARAGTRQRDAFDNLCQVGRSAGWRQRKAVSHFFRRAGHYKPQPSGRDVRAFGAVHEVLSLPGGNPPYQRLTRLLLLCIRAKDKKEADFLNQGITALHIACMFGRVKVIHEPPVPV